MSEPINRPGARSICQVPAGYERVMACGRTFIAVAADKPAMILELPGRKWVQLAPRRKHS